MPFWRTRQPALIGVERAAHRQDDRRAGLARDRLDLDRVSFAMSAVTSVRHRALFVPARWVQ